MKTTASEALYRKALNVMPGGVNSPVRSFKAVGGTPLFIKGGRGSRIEDQDGNQFIDYVMSWGAVILGHAHPGVTAAIKSAAGQGTSFGAPTARETELAELLQAAVPSMERLRLVSSGTEAVMSAVRLSRAFTGRDRVLKFSGNYHGHYDALLVKAGSGGATFGVPDSAGITRSVSADTVVLPYNDAGSLEAVLKAEHEKIACVILEPVCANMGVVPAEPGFIQQARELTARFGIVLIFDEVITGFRLRFGGVQDLLGVRPDLTCLGKIIGAGLPLAAYGGREEIMKLVSPLGPVYQAGTLSGNPIAVAAGLAALSALRKADYRALDAKTAALCRGLEGCLKQAGIGFTLNRSGSIFTIFFADGPVTDFAAAARSDTSLYAKFFHLMLETGVYLPPSQFEANFVSFSHAEEDLGKTVEACRAAAVRLKGAGS